MLAATTTGRSTTPRHRRRGRTTSGSFPRTAPGRWSQARSSSRDSRQEVAFAADSFNGELMTVLLAYGPDDVMIQIGDARFNGWQGISITRSCELMPNNWSLTASAEFMRG